MAASRDIDLWLGLQNLAASHFHRPALVDQVCTLQIIYIIFYSRSGYTRPSSLAMAVKETISEETLHR